MRTAMILIAAAAMCVGAASGRADQPRADDAFQPERILALADQVYNYTLEHPWTGRGRSGIEDVWLQTRQPEDPADRNWIRATFYSGVMELYRATGNEKYREQAERWAEKHRWRVGTELGGMNRLFCAMTWAQLHLLDPDPKKLEPTLAWLATDAPNSPGGKSEIWFRHEQGGGRVAGPLYSDSLYGAPLFPMLYQATGDRKHLDTLHHVFWTVTDATFDEDDALYYRDPGYIGRKSPHGEKVFWSRGNGWVFGAFPRILRYLPEDDPQRERYVDIYRRMAASLAARQQADGFWRSNLADPLHTPMPESSGTAFFVAGYAWGVRNGILDREAYLPVIIRGFNALAGAVQPNGKLGWVQAIGAAPRPSREGDTHEYAAGLFLFAAGEVSLLVKGGVITPEAANPHKPLEPAAVLEGFVVPECAVVDPATGFVYVSNIASPPGEYWDDNGEGFISRLRPDGTLDALRWVESRPEFVINSPKGMCILDGRLYAADNTRVLVIGLAESKPEQKIAVPGAQRLNDMATDGRGVYVSDTAAGRILQLDLIGQGRHETVAKLEGVNGITFHEGRMFAVSWGLHEVYEIDRAGKHEPAPFGLAAHFTNLDGIEVLDDGAMIVSDFIGNKVCLISPDGKTVTTLAELETPADIGLDRKNRRLFVPQLRKDKLAVFALEQD